MSLMQRVTLSFTRYGGQTINEYGGLVDSELETIYATGSLQPFRISEQTTVLPQGKKTSDARMFYTTTELKAADEYTNTKADEVTIQGKVFEVFDMSDFATVGSPLNHYEVVLVRKEPT